MTRQTSQRSAIEQVIQDSDRPMGIDEILSKGKEIVESLNQATVYRNVKLLLDCGTVRQILHPTQGTLYETAEKDHHHHFHCHGCNKVYDVPGCALKEDGIAPKGFVVEDHEVFLYGKCPECSG
ncbi:MAG: transcriptional repressor [Desulfobacteraceae bacterium]